MKKLKEDLNKKNKANAICGMAQMDINNDMHRVQIAQTLDGELSPENLHCDGEISQAEAMRKLRKLNKVCAELIQLDPSVKIYEYYP